MVIVKIIEVFEIFRVIIIFNSMIPLMDFFDKIKAPKYDVGAFYVMKKGSPTELNR